MVFDHSKYNAILFDTMKAFIKVCEDNDLRYFVSGGTAIGAVRHRGLIPWDDDIDVYMPREDYEKLMFLKEQFPNKDYEILNLEDEGYYVPYAKFCDKHTSIWEESKFRFMLGVFIDIFPLDCAYTDFKMTKKWKIKYTREWYCYLNSIRRHSFAELMRYIKSFNIRQAVHLIADIILFRPTKNIWKSRFLSFDKKTQAIKGPNYLFYQCSYDLDKEIFPKSWFSSYAVIPFEDFSVRIMKDWDSYLKQLFGDYMTLPPVEKRVTRHYHHYVNLNRRVSISEAENELA